MESNQQHVASILSTVQCSIEQHSLVKETLHIVKVILEEQRTGRLALVGAVSDAVGWGWADTLQLCGAMINCMLGFVFLVSVISYLCVINIDRLRRIGSDLSVWVAGTGWLPGLMRSQVTGPFDPPAASSGLGQNEMGLLAPLMAAARDDDEIVIEEIDDNAGAGAAGGQIVTEEVDVHAGAGDAGGQGEDAGLGAGREREN